MSKIELFLKLANPDADGKSRWVYKTEFVGEYSDLMFKNGASWLRKNSTIDKKYKIELNRSINPGNSIDAIRLNGFKSEPLFNQYIRKDIKDYYKNQKCVMLGINGSSVNTKIEIDHKDGRKTNLRVSDPSTQRVEDFQPLCKAANDVKRQICKTCKQTNERWDAKNIKGNPYSFYNGDKNYTEELGCIGCYQYDPVAYRMTCVKLVAKEASDYVMKKLYPED